MFNEHVCKGARFVSCAVWKPKSLNVSQLGSNLHVAFDQAPASFGFTVYYLYYKLRQDGPFRLQRCKPVSAVAPPAGWRGFSRWWRGFSNASNWGRNCYLGFSVFLKEMRCLQVQRETC